MPCSTTTVISQSHGQLSGNTSNLLKYPTKTKNEKMQSAGIAVQNGVIKKHVLTNGCNQLVYLNATLDNTKKNIKK